jgi:RND family efflux transporter MFP subunit
MRRLSGTVAAAFIMFCNLACNGGKAPPPAPPPREVEVLELVPTEVRETGTYLGSLLSRESVTVLPQIAGYVRKIHVRPGDVVEAGATLVEVDARQETAALDSASAQRESAAAQLELARRTKARAEALYKEGLATQEEIERSRAEMEAAKAAIRAAEAQVSQRRVQLQYHLVRAAVPGAIGDVQVRVGDYVQATTQLTSIAQADVLELSVAVPAQRAREIGEATTIEILGEEGEVRLTSPVFFVAPEADPRTQLVEVKAVFQNTIGLRPSELVRSRVVYSRRQALQIPAVAVVRQSGQPFAFVLVEKEGKLVVERRPIQLGALGDQAYVLEGGLREGDRIATSSLQALRDGAPVKVKQKG